MVFLFVLLQEHQESILGNTMQSVIALLNNLVAYKDSNMQLLYEQGKLGIEPGPLEEHLTNWSCWASPSGWLLGLVSKVSHGLRLSIAVVIFHSRCQSSASSWPLCSSVSSIFSRPKENTHHPLIRNISKVVGLGFVAMSAPHHGSALPCLWTQLRL